MRKIVAQIMKREVSDQLPLLVVGTPLEALEPLVNAIFGETRTPLGGKDVGTGALTPSMLEVIIQGTARFVQQIDVTKLLTLVSNMEPANLWTGMSVSTSRCATSLTRHPAQYPRAKMAFPRRSLTFSSRL